MPIFINIGKNYHGRKGSVSRIIFLQITNAALVCSVHFSKMIYKSIYNTRQSKPECHMKPGHMLTILHYHYKRHLCKSFTHLSNRFFYSDPGLWNSLPETCDVLFCWVHSCSIEDISLDKVISAIAFTISVFLPSPWPIFQQRTMALIIPMICASRMENCTDYTL